MAGNSYFSLVAFSENCPWNSDSNHLFCVDTMNEMKSTIQTRKEHGAALSVLPGVIVPQGESQPFYWKLLTSVHSALLPT